MFSNRKRRGHNKGARRHRQAKGRQGTHSRNMKWQRTLLFWAALLERFSPYCTKVLTHRISETKEMPRRIPNRRPGDRLLFLRLLVRIAAGTAAAPARVVIAAAGGRLALGAASARACTEARGTTCGELVM